MVLYVSSVTRFWYIKVCYFSKVAQKLPTIVLTEKLTVLDKSQNILNYLG